MLNIRHTYKLLLKVFMALAPIAVTVSCWTEVHPGTYYTFTGQTLADYLEQDSAQRFDSFIKVLKRTGRWGELLTYGKFTCFAPTDEAFSNYLESRNIISIDSLTWDQCDTIVRTHLINNAVLYLAEQSEGGLPQVNLLNRYLVLGYIPDTLENGIIKPRPTINRDVVVSHSDDTVQNGVVHVVKDVIRVSGDYIYDIVKADPNISLFFEAMHLVCLEDSLQKWHDKSFNIPDELYAITVSQFLPRLMRSMQAVASTTSRI